MLPLSTLWLAGLLATAMAQDDGLVLTTPEVVEADEPFTVGIDLSHVVLPESQQCSSPETCDWEFMRIHLLLDPGWMNNPGSQERAKLWRRYCYVEGCIAVNVTNFNTSIPASSFADGFPYTLGYAFFSTNTDGSEERFLLPADAASKGTAFNLTGSTRDRDNNTLQHAMEPWASTIPCSAVPCVERCQEGNPDDMESCVADCRGSSDPLAQCIVRNAVARETLDSETEIEDEDSGARALGVGGTLGLLGVVILLLI